MLFATHNGPVVPVIEPPSRKHWPSFVKGSGAVTAFVYSLRSYTVTYVH